MTFFYNKTLSLNFQNENCFFDTSIYKGFEQLVLAKHKLQTTKWYNYYRLTCDHNTFYNTQALQAIVKVKVKVSSIYNPYVRKCLLERTLVLGQRHCEVRWSSSFPRRLYFPSIFNRPLFAALFAAVWRVASFQPFVLVGSRTVVFRTVGKRSSSYATRKKDCKKIIMKFKLRMWSIFIKKFYNAFLDKQAVFTLIYKKETILTSHQLHMNKVYINIYALVRGAVK